MKSFSYLRPVRLIFFFFTVVWLFSFPALAQTAELPVGLRADHLHYDEGSGMLNASGNVVVTFRALTVEADSLQYDLNQNIATAEGHIQFSRDDYRASVGSLVYFGSREAAVGEDFRATFYTSNRKGIVITHVERISERADVKIGEQGISTTCDYSKPHYHVAAQEVEYYPEDKIVGKSVGFFVGDTQVFWLPYYVYNLKKKSVNNGFPVLGQNQVEGAFAKSTFSYFVDKGDEGEIYIDLTEKKGVGLGFKHNYELGRVGAGSLLLYNIMEKDTLIEDWVLKWNHQAALSPYWRLSLMQNYSYMYMIPLGRSNYTETALGLSFSRDGQKFDIALDRKVDRIANQAKDSFRLSQNDKSSSTQLSYDFTQNTIGSKPFQEFARFSRRQPLLISGLNLGLDVSYTRTTTAEGTPADETLQPQVTLQYRNAAYSLDLIANYFIDPDRDAYTGDRTQEYLERMPEVTLRPNPVDLGLFNLSSELGVGKFHEVKYISRSKSVRDFASTRYKLGLSAAKTFTLPLSSALNLALGWDQYRYDPGDMRFLVNETAGLRSAGWGFSENYISYQRTQSDGNSPFFFDTLGTLNHTLKDTIAFYNGDKFRLTVDGGYNYLTNKYFDIITTLDYKPAQQLKLHALGGYDIENRVYKDLSSTLNFIPVPWLITSGGITYNLNRGEVANADSTVDWTIGEDWPGRWKIKFHHYYDFSSKKYIMRELEVNKDLHCWDLKATYSDFLREWRITFVLKAFPEQPVTFISGGGGVGVEGLKDIGGIGEIGGTSPVRE